MSGSGSTAGAAGRFEDLVPRLLTALVVAPLAIFLLVAGGWGTVLLVAVLGALLAVEWRSVTAHAGGGFTTADAPYAAAAVAAVVVSPSFGFEAGFAALALGLGFGVALDLRGGRGRQARWGAGGLAFIGTALIAFLWLRLTDPYGVLAIVWVVLVVIATDVGGYFAGRLIGGPKLWPAVSPKKTWAGLGGAVALASLTGLIFSGLTTGTFFEEVVTVSAAAALCAQGGDMAESAVKRHFGVKDSSGLLPGHGGALDRFDGLMAATLVVALVTLWRGQTVFIWS
ncbi:MAG: phosphatidate cytidylyltransferase [Pseudomonadota bacterium]